MLFKWKCYSYNKTIKGTGTSYTITFPNPSIHDVIVVLLKYFWLSCLTKVNFFSYAYFMKTVNLLFVVIIIFLGACSSPKKTTTKATLPKATRAEILRGGTSFSNAVVIMVENERTGLNEEYKWLANNYP